MTKPLIGVATTDPYGASLARPFVEAGLSPRYALRGRFPQTMISLVRHGLGVALIDEFSIAGAEIPGIVRLVLKEPASITAHVVTKRGRQLSSFAAFAIKAARREFEEITLHAPWQRRCSDS